jgi:hypothetical protein
MKKCMVCALVLCSVLVVSRCWAGDISVREEIDQLKARVSALEQQLNTQNKCINEQKQCILVQDKKIAAYESRLSQFDASLHRQEGKPIPLIEGLDIRAGATMIVQGTNNVNNAAADVQKKVSRADASYSADITFGKEFVDAGGKAFLHLEAGKGSGLEDDLTLYGNVNRDAGDSQENMQVTELWYEQALCRDKAVLTFGKLDPTAYFDNNEVANDETTQFLGRTFRNSPVIEFSDNTAGIRFAYLPVERLEVSYGVFDGNSDWEKIGDNLFNIGQVTFKTSFFGLDGNYRFYGWRNNIYHTKWLDAEKVKEAAYGFGLSFDQGLSGIATAFVRYGWQNPGVYNPNTLATGEHNYSLAHSWSSGLQFAGKPWGREKDVLAFAVGQIFPSSDYKKAGSSTITSPAAKAEGHFEAYYRICVNDHLSISPDFQYIWNPFGKDVADDTSGIFVAGVRAQLDF